MSTVNSWDGLIQAVNKKVTETMKNEVFNEVKEVYQQHVTSDVYDIYSPTSYERRESHSGLADDKNIIGDVKNNVLEVKNIAQPNESISQPQTPYSPSYDTQFAAWIERGQTYNGNAKYLFATDMSNEPWAKPRPFTENTIKDLASNKQHVKGLKDGLSKRGIKIK